MYISQWITLPTPSYLVLYTFCANLLHSVIMWLIVSPLSPHNLHLLFYCVLSILALIWLVLMAFLSFFYFHLLLLDILILSFSSRSIHLIFIHVFVFLLLLFHGSSLFFFLPSFLSAQSTGAVEYTNYIFAQGWATKHNECLGFEDEAPVIELKKIWRTS